MATIDRRRDKHGATVYKVRVRRKGAPPQTATFTKLSDAKKWAQMTEGALLEGRHFPTSEAKRYTVVDLIARYVEDVLPHKSPSSIDGQTRQLRWWNAQLGHYTLASVTPAMIAACRDHLAKTRKNSTVRRYLAVLSHAFTVAVNEWGWLDDSPMRRVRKPKEPQGRERFLSDDERQRLLHECKVSRNPYLYLVVVLALSTGCRRMEMLSLTWRNVDLQRGIITLHTTKNRERRTSRTWKI
jgi:integrase